MNGKRAKQLRKIAKEFEASTQGQLNAKDIYKNFKKGLTRGDTSINDSSRKKR